MPLVFSLLTLALTVFALIDIITRDNSQVKHMPKMVWLLLVILIPLLGSILWFAIGREYPERSAAPRPPQFAPWATEPPAPARPARDVRSTEQQLADLEREIEEDRLRAELARRRAQTSDDGERA